MSVEHYVGGGVDNPKQAAAQRAQLLKLPEQFEDTGREFNQAWRSKSVAIYMRSNFSDEKHDHLYVCWSVRQIAGMEMLGDLLKQDANLETCLRVARNFENSL
jgi:hypothetical protein